MSGPDTAPACRVCGAPAAALVARHRFYLDYETAVYDCAACGCRFAGHEAGAHERLHANPSSYAAHAAQSARAARYFARSAIGPLRRYLSRTEKYRRVIRFLDARPSVATVAEIGCSRGALASYFIATGRSFHGFDISATAVQEAARRFGDHFHVMDDATLRQLAPFDAIFHVGTIGCVERPIEMTNGLLAALRPGGWLLFNAPVREHLDATGALWLPTPPPDLVTIFPSGFWPARFGAAADVHVRLSRCSAYEAFRYRRGARRPAAATRRLVGDAPPAPRTPYQRFRGLLGAALRTAAGGLPSSLVRPFGAFIVMQKKT